MLAQTESAGLVGQRGRGGLRRCTGTYNEGAIAEWTRAYVHHRRRYLLVSCYRELSELSIVRACGPHVEAVRIGSKSERRKEELLLH